MINSSSTGHEKIFANGVAHESFLSYFSGCSPGCSPSYCLGCCPGCVQVVVRVVVQVSV